MQRSLSLALLPSPPWILALLYRTQFLCGTASKLGGSRCLFGQTEGSQMEREHRTLSKHRTVWITMSEHSNITLSSWAQWWCCGLSVQCPWQACVFEHWAQLVVLWESWSLVSGTTRGGPYLYFSPLPCKGHLQACTMGAELCHHPHHWELKLPETTSS